jgi:hypothetical protein
VFTSRFISWIRKSSLRPQGSEASASAYVRPGRPLHDFLRDRRLVSLEVFADLLHPFREALFQGEAPLVGRHCDLLDQACHERPPLIEVGPQVLAFGSPHLLQVGQGCLDRVPCLRGNHPGNRLVVSGLFADGDGLREAQQIARAQCPGDEIAFACLVQRHLERACEGFIELDLELRRLA